MLRHLVRQSNARILASKAPLGRAVSPHIPASSSNSSSIKASQGSDASHTASREWSPQMQKYLETQAYMFNEKPPPEGQSRQWFYWEPSYYLVWAGLIFALVMGYRAPETIQDWARDEAEERIRRRIQGQPVEYGYNYATFRYMREQGRPHPQDPDLTPQQRQEAQERVNERSAKLLEAQKGRLSDRAYEQVQEFLQEKKE
eukprot:gb/GECG01016622.1/.p1 GENE.gb/GECG01016622.1/~~gb/GECG01016622.1/.p1  ORF type:complete len:201 (+),score=26.19 gb/GECG01016622.1/:1-603(+)